MYLMTNMAKVTKNLVTKMGSMITRTKRHVKTTPVTTEEYLRNEVSKKNISQGADRSDKPVDQYTKLYEHNGQKSLIQL